MTPTREIFWNISIGYVVYPMMVLMLAISFCGFYRRYRLWRLGRKEDRTDRLKERASSLVVYGFGQLRILREGFAGAMHLLFFWGFLVLFIGTLLVAIHEDLHIRILQGTFYLYYSAILDLFGVGAVVGVLMAAYRRYVTKAKRLDRDKGFAIAIAFILFVLVTGFVVEGLRIAATELVEHRDWAAWSPVGFTVALALQGIEPSRLKTLHAVLWWLHMSASFGLMAYLPYSTLSHLILSPANVFFRNLGPKGALRPIDFQNIEPFGVGNIRDFTWKHLLDLDACTRCGRCQDNCPAHLSGKTLSPRSIVQDLRQHLTESAGSTLYRQKEGGKPNGQLSPLVGPGAIVSDEDLWACTTCRACLEHCPVFVEAVDKVLEMRRHQVMVANRVPASAQLALRNLEIRGHPWSGTQLTRGGWAKSLDIKEAGEEGGADLLYWVGCTGALVERNVKVTVAMAQLLKLAGVDFDILGDEESCCGDPSRRLGGEFLFQMIAQQNIETIHRCGAKRLLTHCPHCYNTFKNEYPKYGANFQVVHHTELLADLLCQGRLRPQVISGTGVVYHDSCYLGRYNGIFDAPRKVLSAISGGQFLEMERREQSSFCCGAGGGHAWMEEQGGQRMNLIRLEEAQRVGGKGIASSCPFCLQMFEDGIAGAKPGESFQAWDIAELVYHSVRPPQETPSSADDNRQVPLGAD